MDSDSDCDDRLLIAVDEDETANPIEQRQNSEVDIGPEVSSGKALREGFKQSKSCLPESLKRHITRSRARSIKSESIQSAIHPQKDVKIKRASDKIDKSRNAVLSATSGSVCRKSTLFTHPGIGTGRRLAQLIDPIQPKQARPKIIRAQIKTQSSKKASRVKTNVGNETGAGQKCHELSKKASQKKRSKPAELSETFSQQQNNPGEKRVGEFLDDIIAELDCVEHSTKKNQEPLKVKTKKKEEKRTLKRREKTESQFIEHQSVRELEDLTEASWSNSPTCNSGSGNEEEESSRCMTRAGRRKLTRTLLRQGNSRITRFAKEKAEPARVVRRRMPRRMPSDEDLSSEDVLTYDTFLKYPSDVPYPKTDKFFYSECDQQMKGIYEDYRKNVQGKGVFVPNLKAVLLKKIEETEKELTKETEIVNKLKEEDSLGAEPFIDYISYRFHPLYTRGEARRWIGMHESQFQSNSCALSSMPGLMLRRKDVKTKYIILAPNERDLDKFSASIEQFHSKWKGKDRKNEQLIDARHLNLIKQKIDSVRSDLRIYKRCQQLNLAEGAIKEETSTLALPCEDNAILKDIKVEDEQMLNNNFSDQEIFCDQEGLDMLYNMLPELDDWLK